MEKPGRLIRQIACAAIPDAPDGVAYEAWLLYALCEDGTLWRLNQVSDTPATWRQVPPIPNDEILPRGDML